MRKLLFIALTSLLLIACVKDKKTSWNTDLLAPMVQSDLTISDLLNNSDVVENPDSTLKLVYSAELYSITADSLIQFPDTVFEFGASLLSLELPNDTVTYVLTLGQIARAQGGLIEFFILANHNDSMTIPALSGLSSGDIEIDMGSFFESIALDSGIAKIIITNELPIDIEDVDFMVSNASQHSGSLILRDTFPSIPTNTFFSKEIPIHGKTIYADIIAKIVELSTPGSDGKPVLIDTNASITAEIIIKDLKPDSATAIWPEQNVVDEKKLVTFAPGIDYVFKDAILRGGAINFDMFSSIQDSIYITYTVPNLVHPTTGLPFQIDTVIPPAPANGYSTMNAVYPMDDYYFLLNGYGIESHYNPKVDYDGSGLAGDAQEVVNAYITILEARIQYSGQLKTIALDDTLYVHASIVDLTPKYARGHMGNTIKKVGPDSVSFDIFNNVRSGSIDLEDVNFEIEADNGIGATALATFNNLWSKNAQGNIVTLTMNDNTMDIDKAIDNGSSANHISSTKTLNSGNSNITDFISNLPNKIIYDMSVEINGVDNPSSHVDTVVNTPPNFIYYERGMTANLNMEIPLSFIADSLVLVDTIDFSFNSQGNGEVESGTFTLLVNNGFPFDATTTLYFMDDNDVVIDSLWKDESIIRGNIDGNGKVISTNQSQITFDITKERMDLIKTAEKIYIIAGFHTFDITNPSAVHYKIFSYYNFKVKLVGDFNYMLSN
jgi:hypothetical protein